VGSCGIHTKGKWVKGKKAVLATVLVIVFQGTEKVGIYDDQPAASAALWSFVDAHWDEAHHGPAPATRSETQLNLFFAGEGDSYVMAEADLGEAAQALGSPL
jgi:hypothetical protein